MIQSIKQILYLELVSSNIFLPPSLEIPCIFLIKDISKLLVEYKRWVVECSKSLLLDISHPIFEQNTLIDFLKTEVLEK